MSGHTPGPWVVVRNGSGVPHVVAKGQGSIARALLGVGGSRDANAQLMAAAPELLEALGWALQFAFRHQPQNKAHCEAYARARAALAKARGETP